MKQILYIGNHLSRSGGNPSVAEVMAPLLSPDVVLHLVSNKQDKVLRILDMVVAVMRYGRKEQPMVMDVYSTLNFYYAVVVAVVCRVLHIPYIGVLHGGNLPHRLMQSPRLSRFVLGNAQKLVAPSAYLQQAFQQVGYSVDCIPNFIFLEQYSFLHRTSVRPRLLWVRAFDAIYNPEMAIHIVHKLAEKFPDVQLCMVGPDKDGSLERCKNLAVTLGVSEHIVFTGKLTKAAWITLSTSYDIFINTTRFDNVPVSILEAMALGFPVISTNVGGLPYLITSEIDGILVPEGDTSSFVSAIEWCLETPEGTTRISRRARERVIPFDWNSVKPMWLEYLRN